MAGLLRNPRVSSHVALGLPLQHCASWCGARVTGPKLQTGSCPSCWAGEKPHHALAGGTCEQMEKARGAEELLGACLAALSDDAGSVGARERLGLLPDNGHDDRKRDAQAVHAALLQVGAGAGQGFRGCGDHP